MSYFTEFEKFITDASEVTGIPFIYDHKKIGTNKPQIFCGIKRIASMPDLGGCGIKLTMDLILIVASPAAGEQVKNTFSAIEKIRKLNLADERWDTTEISLPQIGTIPALTCELDITI